MPLSGERFVTQRQRDETSPRAQGRPPGQQDAERAARRDEMGAARTVREQDPAGSSRMIRSPADRAVTWLRAIPFHPSRARSGSVSSAGCVSSVLIMTTLRRSRSLRTDGSRLLAQTGVLDVHLRILRRARKAPDRPPVRLPPRAPLSRGNGASERAAAWSLHDGRHRVRCRRPRLPSTSEARLRGILARLESPYVVLGMHDIAVTRDPFSRRPSFETYDAQLLRRRLASFSGEHVSSLRRPGDVPCHDEPETSAMPVRRSACCCATPRHRASSARPRVRSRPAGHLHAGRSASRSLVPLRSRIRAPRSFGCVRDAAVMHVSPNGTKFVPFRFFASRSTELVLHARLDWLGGGHAVISHDVLPRTRDAAMA